MSQLTRLSQALIDEPLAPRTNVEDLRTRSRRRHQRSRSIMAGLLVLIVIGAFSFTKIESTSPSFQTLPKITTPNVQLASYFRAAGAVPDATLQAVGLPSNVAVPTKITPSVSTVATNGVVSYVGGEYCPYCAIQRWALLVALSKFGSFTNLDGQVISSSTDVYPGLASWSFVGAKYSSPYFTFDPTELTSSTPSDSGGYQPLEKMSAGQLRAFNKYNPQGALPFVDIGNHYVTLGASASPSVLEGLTLGDIGSDLSSASSPVAQAIDGTANYLIAASAQWCKVRRRLYARRPLFAWRPKLSLPVCRRLPRVQVSRRLPHSRRRTPHCRCGERGARKSAHSCFTPPRTFGQRMPRVPY